jgi:hypothetical protein
MLVTSVLKMKQAQVKLIIQLWINGSILQSTLTYGCVSAGVLVYLYNFAL